MAGSAISPTFLQPSQVAGRPDTDHPPPNLLHHRCPRSPAVIRATHARMLRLDLLSHPYTAGRLLSSIISDHDNLSHAIKVFDQIPQPNLYSWNILIRAYSTTDPTLALLLFTRLLHDGVHRPDKFTFPFAIKAASCVGLSGGKRRVGHAIHGMVVKFPGVSTDIFVGNSLIHFYACCGDVVVARKLFGFMPARDVVSWNSIINGLANAGFCDEAMEVFQEMCVDGVSKPNDVTMVGVLNACGKKGDLGLGKWIHRYIESNGIEEDLILLNAVLDMYVKCGSLEDAKDLFDVMHEKDSISWTTMLVGYAKSGDFDTARRLFDAMPDRGLASWNALISTYEQGGRPSEALDAFREALLAEVKPNEITLVMALSACAELGALEMGCWIHTYIRRNNLKLNNYLMTSLIDMYSKCGDLRKAVEVFQFVEEGDVFVWSAMIAGMAMHGRGKDALDLFMQMLEANVMPNGVTFTNVLSACSHSGLVNEGWVFLGQMLSVYGIEPKVQHYASMVDILGRAGFLEEAVDLILKMPVPTGPSVWGALLGSCVIHRNVELGEYACNRLLKLQPANDGAYVLLSNLYAKVGRWDGVARLRKLMKDMGLRKDPGCSSMEVGGVMHKFLAGDTSHPMSEKIHSKLKEVMLRLKEFGYQPNKSDVLQCVEEEEVKEQALHLHSEKLAIAFGLISTESSQGPIRIMKNLRVCEDCHTVAKLVSSIYGREIILRDRYRFHYFMGGQCSCRDYW